nr:hypothetical protein [Variovorax sp.]
MPKKFFSTSSAPQKKWNENGKPFCGVEARPKVMACHGPMVETIGTPLTSQSWPAASAASLSCTSSRSTFSRSSSSLDIVAPRLASDWVSRTTISTL